MDEAAAGRAKDLDQDLVDSPIDGAPIWIRAVQAAAIGVVAGFALNALVSIVVVHGESLTPKHPSPRHCKKQTPAKDSATPKGMAPATSSVRWNVDGVHAGFDLPSDTLLTP